MSHDVG
jgi:hypothetical protein